MTRIAKLSEQMREARVARGWRQRDLATRANLNQSMVSRWERRQVATIETVEAMLDALNLDVSVQPSREVAND